VITGSTIIAGVIGSPVGHSLSPALHNAAFEAAGIDWVYVAFDVEPGRAADALHAMRTLQLGGLSVTMPHKESVADACDELDAAAATLRSVNTVVRTDEGRLRGYSTDGAGFVASLREHGVEPAGARIVVLGAGGAARSVVDALARGGAGQVVVVNRSHDRAEACASVAGPIGRVGDGTDVSAADILINATSVGMGDDRSIPCDPAALRPSQVIADLVYHPLRTPLLEAAISVGATTVDGLGMLVHQAALQQLLWRGALPDTDVMREAALRELASRPR
jgi:shikimate dehydrogenase